MACQMRALLSFSLFFCFFVSPFHAVSLVPNGSQVAFAKDYIIVSKPDGASFTKHLSANRTPSNNKKRSEIYPRLSLFNAQGDFTYFKIEFTVPETPTSPRPQIDFLTTLWNDATGNYLGIVFRFHFIRGDGIHWTFFARAYDPLGSFEADYYYINSGDNITAEVILNASTNRWVANGYLNGNLVTAVEVFYLYDVYIHFPERSDNYVIATSTDTAAQSFLQYVPFNTSKTVGRKFILTEDGYICLASNINLVMDVNAGNAYEGARVVVYPKKPFVTQNQQWYMRNGSIYSKLGGGQYALAVTSDNKIVISTTPRNLPLQFDTQGPVGSGIKLRAEFAIETTNVDSCDMLPQSNFFQARNVVLKKQTEIVSSPEWYSQGDYQPGPCNLTFWNTSDTFSISWNSTVAVVEEQ